MSAFARSSSGRGPVAPKLLRCAIYTRKSTEHGLEQEFNSLDNQREAAEAYVKSQAHEGWRLLPECYDDGGFSGGSLARPALKRLLDDVEAGRVDVIVVYKVDRLTRSLADFAKLVELFDRHAASFVSVTQAFNTTSSMGRLTLNVLLSFAQFEREVSGERIRDKIAASKRKGLRVGGPIPLGYRVIDKKLVPCPVEAEHVGLIFRRYVELGSLIALIDDLQARGIVTKANKRRDGSVRGGIRFGKGGLASLLKNRCYIGEVIHKGTHYPGQHEAIVERELFDAVGRALQAGAPYATGDARPVVGSMLKGLLFDSRGHRMTPSSARKNGARYRYYVSCVLAQGRRADAGARCRVPGPELEALVLAAVPGGPEASAEPHARAEWAAEHIGRIVIEQDAVKIMLRLSENGVEHPVVTVAWPSTPLRRRRGIIGTPGCADFRPMRSETRARLVQNIADGRAWLAELISGRVRDTLTIAQREGFSERHVRTTLNLAFLAPDIVQAAVDGTLPDGIGVVRLSEVDGDWSLQRAALVPRDAPRTRAVGRG